MIDTSAAGIHISGDQGRLGRALSAAAPGPIEGWDQPDLDLDDPDSCAALVRRRGPRLVLHTAAMTAVDQAALEPDTAMRRNGQAVGAIARACREIGAALLLVSSNEVFDGTRTDGRPYREDEPANPGNPYALSKLAGEQAALDAFDGDDGLWITRTAWLFGPPGADFPEKITAAADRVPGPLPVVSDEIGCPTYGPDLARAIYQLVERTDGGIYHLVNAGSASRFEWAKAVLDVRRPGRELKPIAMADYERASKPPLWGVLDTTKARSAGVVLRPWADALAEYLGASA